MYAYATWQPTTLQFVVYIRQIQWYRQ